MLAGTGHSQIYVAFRPAAGQVELFRGICLISCRRLYPPQTKSGYNSVWMVGGEQQGDVRHSPESPQNTWYNSAVKRWRPRVAICAELLNALPAAVYLTDKAGRITFYNEAAATLWGCRPTIGSAEWCGSWRLYWPDGTPLPHDQCPMAMALKEERAINGMEAAAERPDGTRVPFLAFPQPLRDDKGTVVGAINMLVDISERKRIEVQAHDAEERFRRLFSTAPMAVFVCDKDAVIVDFNEQAVELWGREPVRGVEKHCGSVKLWLPDGTHLPHEQSPVRSVLSTGIPVRNVEVSIERPDGSLLPVLVNFAPLWNADEEITGAITSFVDISERKSVEEAAQRLASIVESSDDAIVSKDLSGIIKTWNTAAERLFGYLAEEVVGKSITILIPPDRENEEPAILERLARGERIDHYETVRRRKDGTLIDVSLTVSPVKDKTGKIVGASKIVRDITERKRKEAQIALLTREVDHRSKNLLALVQAAVHLSNGDTPEAIKDFNHWTHSSSLKCSFVAGAIAVGRC